MGYSIRQLSGSFLIKKKNMTKALRAVKALKGKETIKDCGGAHFAWVSRDYLEAKTLKEALIDWRWNLEIDPKSGDGYDLYFDGEKSGDDEILFRAIAPFVEHGEIEMVGEDDCRWRWLFKNKKFYEQAGHIVYGE